MIPNTRTVDAYDLSDGTHTVELRKLRTPNGERLLVTSDGASARLDALALETLTWQDDAFFVDLTGQPHEGGPDAFDDEPTMQIGNEYTTIRIRAHETADGPVISLRSPKLEYQCWLGAAELDAIARKPMSFFSDLLRTPLGPESDHSHVL
jgi:hypothetical protein